VSTDVGKTDEEAAGEETDEGDAEGDDEGGLVLNTGRGADVLL
jgi:hypothetical protein